MLALFFIVFGSIFSFTVTANQEPVYVVPLEGAVEKGLASFIERSFAEAKQNNAVAVILEIDSEGGNVDAAFEIAGMIKNAPFPVHAYVKNNALSAAAYLALSSDDFYMVPGSVIGAAEIRAMGQEEPVSDVKVQSAWEAQMKTAAERQGKDPEIALAMVDRNKSIEGLIEDGQLLTLTSQQAEELAFSNGTYSNLTQLLVSLGLEENPVLNAEPTLAETIARIITNPIVATLLLTLGIAALVIEVMTGGFGLAGGISILAFTLFFGGHVIAGMAGYEVIVLFVLGIILMLVEAVVPNFGLIGLSGVFAFALAIILSASTAGEGLWMLLVSILLSIVIVFVAFRFLKKRNFFSTLILSHQEKKDMGYTGAKDSKHLLGQEGTVVTPMRPSGTVELEETRVDAVTEGGFIAAGAKVKVVKLESNRVVVREVK